MIYDINDPAEGAIFYSITEDNGQQIDIDIIKTQNRVEIDFSGVSTGIYMVKTETSINKIFKM